MSFPVRRVIEFVYSASIAYLLEFGDLYVRVYFNDELITTVTTPYAEDHLFELQYRQIGDVMRITHPSYKQRKLSRTDATTFTLEEIDFTDGPFMTRNDLVDPLDTNSSTMSCSVTAANATGILTSSVNHFYSGHVGCLFQLTHVRTTTTVSASGSTSSSAIFVKGSFRFITRGTWTGTVYVKRRENGGDWEVFRTYKGSTGANQNVSWTLTENSDNVEYYIDSSTASSEFRAELSCEDVFHSGVVKVTGYLTTTTATVLVISRLESTAVTKRWAEGSWSNYRGWPASITFYEDRCVYAGALTNTVAENFSGYPTLTSAGV